MSSVEAIIHEGGRQYAVQKGTVIDIDRLDLRAGDTVVFEDVRLLADENGVRIGKPRVAGASVQGQVQGEVKGRKLVVFKYRRRKSSATRSGHRQKATRVRITSVQPPAGGEAQ